MRALLAEELNRARSSNVWPHFFLLCALVSLRLRVNLLLLCAYAVDLVLYHDALTPAVAPWELAAVL